MGLGPPVCVKCETILSYDKDYEVKNINPWYCKACGNIKDIETTHLWILPYDKIVEIEKKEFGHSIHEELHFKKLEQIKALDQVVHKVSYSSQPDILIDCNQVWTTPAWGKTASTNIHGVYRADNDSLYTFESNLVTCKDCLDKLKNSKKE